MSRRSGFAAEADNHSDISLRLENQRIANGLGSERSQNALQILLFYDGMEIQWFTDSSNDDIA